MPAYLLSLELENVRCFGPRQRLDLSDGHGKPARWTVILGNNGTGKTTLLQAMALLSSNIGNNHTQESRLLGLVWQDPAHLFLRQTNTQPSIALKAGSTAKLEGGHEVIPYEIELFINNVSCLKYIPKDIKAGVVHLFSCAYGANRRMGSVTLGDSGRDSPLESLFSEDASLRNPEEWLLQSDYLASKASPVQEQEQRRLEQVKSILLAVLPEVDDLRVRTHSLHGKQPHPVVELKTPYGWVSLRQMGLGYRTMIAWMVDFASRLFERYPDSPDPLAEPAVALIDEIDLHLHPRWQRQLLTYLSDRFPNTQFIATAHSPLVVQAASEANLVVLRREGDHVIIDNQPACVAGWRVDQILTSSLFDLPSARPPALDRDLERRKELLARARLTAQEREELRAIAARIGELPTGETPEDIEAMDIIRRAARKLEDSEPKTP